MLTRAELGLAPGDFAVLAIGDLNDNKNHRVLVEAMAGLPVHVKLFIAGDGPLREELEALADRLGVADRVSLLGFRSDVAALLNACDLFCFPSKREGLPVSLIEAMATGTPCLASSTRGCIDVLGDARMEFLVDKFDADAWAKRISWMAGEARPLAPSEFTHRAQFFGSETLVKVVAGIYDAVCSQREVV